MVLELIDELASLFGSHLNEVHEVAVEVAEGLVGDLLSGDLSGVEAGLFEVLLGHYIGLFLADEL